ncbi:MAG: phosphoadenosine phosphosulfate reductase family protein [Sphingobacteriales bacterium]|jgi:3'-phosphoadenosine 5'-phosphosulfate sulfotransferase (PAPS reductase)/FAD synthetase|nr:phosphoadenosine phosphosulfate reductase family protein [Sphingobacteriales bacterium]MBK6890979.1 phosphoadenosine phosphosulfate reductase family protein [Sphingobacteriales bacterium]MBK7525969.1 phosphoadenosine phosphosulfate reductase family protein [Sphingobacteriales bacterium]MBK8677684.1 phosphoadenosine phosphosulfate reductase family protein [Sphingobacteriales bacterium]MBL0247668.1 phosphoadenosine phosphosulfate reductase family protein [Sphingobacteriales bacterium]
MSKIRHVLGISGGKDSAALAIYIKTRYPSLDLEFYSCDTGKELDETYQLIQNLEVYLGIKINLLRAAENSSEVPFDHFLKMYGGYLPSSSVRWCTKKLKLEPFEKYVGTDDVVSYVGIRGDEDREGYISTKKNIQSIFPFRKNIWSEDVITKVLSNQNIDQVILFSKDIDFGKHQDKVAQIVSKKINTAFTQAQKLCALLDTDVKGFNHLEPV